MRKFLSLLLAATMLGAPEAIADSLGAVNPGTLATQSNLSGCVFNTAPPTVANGQQVAFQCNNAGALQVGTVVVIGNAASGAADSSNPVKVGGKYNTTSILLTNGQRGDLQVGANGALITQPFAVEALRWQASVSLTTTGNVQIAPSCGAGLRNYITHLDWSSIAATVVTQLEVVDGASTVIITDNIPGGALGRDHNYDNPFRGTAATAMNVAVTLAPTGAVQVQANGFCAP